MTLEEAMEAKSNNLRLARNPVQMEIENFRRNLARTQDQAARQPGLTTLPLDVACMQSYISFLGAVDAPADALLRQRADQAAANEIEQNRQKRVANQRAIDEANALSAQRNRTAEIVKNQAELEARKQAEAAMEAEKQDAEAAREEAAKLPHCDAAETIKALEAEMYMRRTRVVRANHVGDDSTDPTGGTRVAPLRLCKANLLTADGPLDVSYIVKWSDDAHRDISVLPLPAR